MIRRRLAILILPLVAALTFAVSPARTTIVHAGGNCGITHSASGYVAPTYAGYDHYIWTDLTVICSGPYVSYTLHVTDNSATTIVSHIRTWVCGGSFRAYGTAQNTQHGSYTTPWILYNNCGPQADTAGAYDFNSSEYYYFAPYAGF